MSDKRLNRDYDVGYGKPPEEYQWPKGTSGNPNGRPKQDKTLDADIEDIFLSPVEFLKDGKRKRISSFRAALELSYRRAVNGNPEDMYFLAEMTLRHGERRIPVSAPQDLVPIDFHLTEEGLGPLRERGYLPADVTLEDIPLQDLQEAFQKFWNEPEARRDVAPDDDDPDIVKL